jgi:hypothetical protein
MNSGRFTPGQIASMFIGIPFCFSMLRGIGLFVTSVITSVDVQLVFLLPAFVMVPYIYAKGLGTLIALALDWVEINFF